MSIPNRVSDASATMPMGTTSVTTSGGGTFVVNNEKIELEWKEASEEYTATGGPGRKAATKQRWNYEGEWQVSSNGVTYPNAGQTFSRTCPNDGAKTFVLKNVPPYEASADPGQIRVIKVTGYQVIYGVITA